jgi:hypothetical protein
MTDAEYLDAVLREQTFTADSAELAELRNHRADVEALLVDRFGEANPTIRYGGSVAKGTMLKRSYDLDLPTYFAADGTSAGTTLEEIYHNVEQALREDYWTEKKGSAIRLRSRDRSADTSSAGPDFHIDVVPGRFFDDSETDVWLYQNLPDRERLKTNLDVHLDHVRKSGVRPAIRLTKLWRVNHNLPVRNFVLELLTIDLLSKHKTLPLPVQLLHVLEHIRDHSDGLCVEDPANPSGNDLSALLDDGVKQALKLQATLTLMSLDRGGWDQVFGPVEADDRSAALRRAAATVPAAAQHQPWSRE